MIGFTVSVREDGVSYARVARPDPVELGCVDPRDTTGATVPTPAPVEIDLPDALPCDGAIVLRELDRAFRRREIAPWLPLVGVFIVWIVIAAVMLVRGPGLLMAGAVGVSVLATWIAYRIAKRVDTASGSSLLVYSLDEASAERFAALQLAAQRLALAGRMWHVASDGRLLDPRQKYGARRFLRRYRIRPGLSIPAGTAMNLRVPTIYGESRKYFFLPDRVLVYDDRGVRALAYDRLAVRTSEVLVVEDEDVPADARVVETTWLHLDADGGPDPAVANNRRYPIVLYGALELAGPIGASELFHGSVPAALEAFAAAIELMAYGNDVDFDAGSPGDEARDTSADDQTTDGVDDEIFEDALRFLIDAGACDVGALVERFGVSFGRAARIVATLELEGFVGPPRADGRREVRGSARRYVELLDRASAGRNGDGKNRKARRTAVRRGRSRTLEPHEILGVSENATKADVAEAYRELAQLYHPDKVASLAPEFQDLADQRMKEINAAYTALNGGADAGRPAGRR
jgi:hypothetical protein